jgi:hypothetical protein
MSNSEVEETIARLMTASNEIKASGSIEAPAVPARE